MKTSSISLLSQIVAALQPRNSILQGTLLHPVSIFSSYPISASHIADVSYLLHNIIEVVHSKLRRHSISVIRKYKTRDHFGRKLALSEIALHDFKRVL